MVYNDDKIVVFEKDKDYGKDQILITFRDEYLEEFGIKGNIPYEYWFEFTTPDSSAEIIADFTFDVTESGAQKLAALRITSYNVCYTKLLRSSIMLAIIGT